MTSPYAHRPVTQWSDVTRTLIASHPLTLGQIHDVAQTSWQRLWRTTVGDEVLGFPLAELDPPATVIGYFFEKLIAKELTARLPGQWRGGRGSEKDLHCISDPTRSIEIKSSGQLGYKVYGNRSYGQHVVNVGAAKKDKSGYYITINFHAQVLTRLRFGWIDADDWHAQKAATGQMAGLSDEVYRHKLETIPGRYILAGPVQLVEGVGAKAADELHSMGIQTIGQLLNAQVSLPRHEKLRARACEQYRGLY